VRSLLLALLAIPAFAQTEFNPIAKTVIGGQIFDIYQDENKDQTVLVKSKSKPSENPEEESKFNNILNRQTIWEIGVSVGAAHASKDATLVKDPQGNLVPFGDSYGVPTEKKQNYMSYGVHFNYHPPIEALKRLTLGVSGHFYLKPEAAFEAYAWTTPKENPLKHWTALAEYDFVVLPSKRGATAFSAGYTKYDNGTFLRGPRKRCIR
jgi:hypothetical protein